MKGARPLDNAEILLVSQQFDGTFAIRNRSLFMSRFIGIGIHGSLNFNDGIVEIREPELGVSVGGRISELLALTIGDVWQNNKPVKDLLFQKDRVKGKESSRMVPVNADGREAIASLMAWHQVQYGSLSPTRPLFTSRKGGGNTAMTRGQAHKVLEAAFNKAGLNGKLATHSLRKSFAQRVYDGIGDIYAVQELLGHRSIETTKKYLGISYQKLQQAVEAIETQCNRTPLLYHSPKDRSTDSLLVELQRRGVDVSSAIEQMTEHQAAANDDLVIPIDRARYAKR